MLRRPLVVLLSAFLLGASTAAAQIPKSAMIAVIETHKASILRYIDAAPDSMLGFRPTPGVRTFAEQIEHTALSDAEIAHMSITGSEKIPSMGDRNVYLKNKAALRQMAAASMDHTLEMLRGLSDAAFSEEITTMGKKMPRYRALMELLDHFPWTLGQTVPYLRLNGVTPPEYTPF